LGSPTQELIERVRHPFDPLEVAHALVGLPTSVGRHLAGVALAASAEADLLLDGMGETVRSLGVATTDSPVRCVGEIRGPVLWSETLGARAASPGAGNVFICKSPTKAYDTEANRVLVAALVAIKRAAHDAEQSRSPADAGIDVRGVAEADETAVRRARHNGARASRWLEHRTLTGVSRGRPGGRAMQKARSGSKARTYRPAVEVLVRAGAALSATDLEPFADARTLAQHRLVAELLRRLDEIGVKVPALRAESGTLRAGPMVYLHPRRHAVGLGGGPHPVDALHGVLVGDTLVDVPDRLDGRDPERAAAVLAARSQGRIAIVAYGPPDVDRALAAAGFPV
jgi:hypothetical protein